MNEQDRAEAQILRGMPSHEAADWIVSNHATVPRSLAHRSWRVADQVRLLWHYFPERFGFASASPIEAFLTFMSVWRFCQIVGERLDDLTKRDADLFLYYLRGSTQPYLQTETDRAAISALLARLEALT